ncbi:MULTISPECIES: ATP-binding protein [Streptomyces]|uniref:Anti-sigma regulatory factor (Ser/Thr protein kinase) n=1 Tax=Streptomyces melanosporofaciens TaxID=67327 RepID=A0A1H4ZZ59_STRMJ|nr:ATP-binding protein [Streptomyces melanosporofaciens]SED35486.1 Anti-sigma regulatory factor (Ser/Thr protein kinase) [Streptomyces melanosporofaciens]
MTVNPAGAVATVSPSLPNGPQPRRRMGSPDIHPTPQELVLRLATDPAAVGLARRATIGALRGWGVPDTTADDIVLMVDELVTNAIEHATGPVWLRLRLRRGCCVICKVGDGCHEAPRLRHSDPDAENGRGLFLVSALADAFGARITTTGKVIWFRRRVRDGRVPAPRTTSPTDY